MFASSPLDAVPLWGIFAGTLAGILLFVEIGFRLGHWRRVRSGPEKEKEAPVGGMVAAELGLLAFLLAFTFGLAAARFDNRRQVLLNESNAIGTAYLRAAMIPEPHRAEVRRLLREYTDARIAGAQGDATDAAIRRSEELQVRLWAEAVAVMEKDSHSIAAGLFVESLNDVIDLHAVRVQAGLRSRIPGVVWTALFAVATLAFGSMGYQSGLSGSTRSPAILALALAFASVVWLVADLDRPQHGMLRVSQQPMIDLRKSMPEPTP